MTSTRVVESIDGLGRRRWLTLGLIVVANAVLQTVFVLPSPWGSGPLALATALGSALALVAAAVFVVRALRTDAEERSMKRAIAARPWRFVMTLLGTVIVAGACWVIALLCVAFLPHPLAITVAWLLIGALACWVIAWWLGLRRPTV